MNIIKKTFNDFELYTSDEYNSFVHININNPSLFYSQMFDYFFDKDRLLKYIENKSSVSFLTTAANYTGLF